MKTTRRILSLLLVLAMIACLSVTAFAEGVTPRVEVTIQPNDGTTSTFTIQASAGQTLYDAVRASGGAKWKTVADYYDSSKTHKVLTSYKGYASTPINTSNAVDQAKLSAKGYDYSKITWYSSRPGYGMISYDGTTYTFIYAGYDWTYSSNIHPTIYDYMCCYSIAANEVVHLNYEFNVSVWTSTTPLV